MPQRFRLAQLVAARICHDLGGPAGTVEGALSLLGAGSEEALAVAQEGAAALRLRLTLFRAAWGGGLGDTSLAELLALLDGQVAGGRARIVLADGLAPQAAVFPAPLAQVLLNALLLAGDALPRGGTILLGGDPAEVLMVRPEGEGAAWPPGLAAALAAGGLDPALAVGLRGVRAPVLAALAADLKVPVALGLGGPRAAGPAPLLIGPAPPAGP
ncbi:histidine phosphotransferase family protein [Caldovatus aquaticus]|uniref:Histidine phosphotransferase ChpT C-terminal domain-containing protein n=1 Tax=Caldovatus aquaticus TaxID=2865671 RepID=A0ABS7EYP3_9PROT|nr:histidine phosphotransferase family protein [Caldovatus aquaticus]MBW8268409.1 hypothetical protein [Caldovatus aquaticus]